MNSREMVVEAARRSAALGLTHGTAGNVSVRIERGMAISPTGIPAGDLAPSDVALVDLDGAAIDEGRKPSSEWRLHAELYRVRTEFGAIVHTHSPAATAIACLRRDLPPFHYMIAKAGGDSVRCAPYATFGTAELAAHAVAAMEGRRACLLAHHGLVAAGRTMDEALAIAEEVEFLCGVYLSLLPLGEPPRLDPEAMRDVRARFADYGQRPPA